MQRNAYAKLNLSLAITGMREDGYHMLDMVMQRISLYDVVTVEKAEDLRVFCEGVPEEKNTAYKAAAQFISGTGIPHGVHITIQKNIPAQAGLGGGSSDAATTLLLMNEMFKTKLSAEELSRIGLCVGADVPFFLLGGCARAQGVGEVLTPLENNCGFRYLLVKPEGGVNTRAAYEAYHRLPKDEVDVQAAVDALGAADCEAYFRYAGNALAPAGKLLCPEVEQALRDCYGQGARFAMMTGSGSCVFAVFENEAKLTAAQDALGEKYPFVAVANDI
ncbi:4-(cytidine 5'-diphospho)-2-C-methyl-D-erythritol kinase [Christensenellaceae bacterium OttesenSCG-928-K19]|nr:4-(cytidine 5'-diphospho)-2-C-methyl-D-erythritol kinase [Christensenellaceae bacterium OttesenSCG-928-K19]